MLEQAIAAALDQFNGDGQAKLACPE